MQLWKPELKLLKRAMIESAAASYPCCLYCQIITKPTLQMVCVGCVTSLHNQFCMNKMKVYIMRIPSTGGWSFLGSVLLMQLNWLQTLFQPVPHRVVRIKVISVSWLASRLESTSFIYVQPSFHCISQCRKHVCLLLRIDHCQILQTAFIIS